MWTSSTTLVTVVHTAENDGYVCSGDAQLAKLLSENNTRVIHPSTSRRFCSRLVDFSDETIYTYNIL